jgi:hypothetical protein
VELIHICKLSMSLGESLLAESTSWDEEHTHHQDIQDDKREIARLEALLKEKVSGLSPEDRQKFMTWFEAYIKRSATAATTPTETTQL